jgi:DNA-binding XRE family transcriptional regulator
MLPIKKKLPRKKFYTLDEVKDHHIGKRGTQSRESYEMKLYLSFIGYKIQEFRKQKRLTQEQLGEKLGVQKAQISKLEKGSANMTLSTLFKIFSAMRADVSISAESWKPTEKFVRK